MSLTVEPVYSPGRHLVLSDLLLKLLLLLLLRDLSVVSSFVQSFVFAHGSPVRAEDGGAVTAAAAETAPRVGVRVGNQLQVVEVWSVVVIKSVPLPGCGGGVVVFIHDLTAADGAGEPGEK